MGLERCDVVRVRISTRVPIKRHLTQHLSGGFKRKALPNADVIAFVRPVPSKSVLSVLWAGEDQVRNTGTLSTGRSDMH